MSADFTAWLEEELERLARTDRLRACPELAGASRTRPRAPAGELLTFCSNDYLGLAAHPALAAAAADSARTEGFGASASRLVTGDLPSHRALEAELAAFTGREAALLYPTGYQTNVGVIAALAGAEDLIVSDAANHASLIDGCRLSRATIAVYPHGDPAAARAALARPEPFRRRFLVTESLFSMDGDFAPLAALAAAATAHRAVLVVDEAHALGVVGPGGRGLAAATGVVPDVLIGTLGKAFGAAGGFVAGPAVLRSFLVNRSRTFIFTTALPAPVAAAAGAALRIIRSADGDARRASLSDNIQRLSSRLPARYQRGGRADAADTPSPILPIVLGADLRALEAAAALRSRGIFVAAIRPPTVPEGTSRLRVTFSSEHTEGDLYLLATALAEILP